MSLLDFLGDLFVGSKNTSAAKDNYARIEELLNGLKGEGHQLFDPYIGYGTSSGNVLNGMLTGNDQQFGDLYNRFKNTTGYQETLKAGTNALNTNAANRNLLNSGANLKNISNFGQEHEQQYLNNFYDRLQGQETIGLGAAGSFGNLLGSVASGQVNNSNNLTNALINRNNSYGNAFHNLLGDAQQAAAFAFGG
jgi:hypothetical protein